MDQLQISAHFYGLQLTLSSLHTSWLSTGSRKTAASGQQQHGSQQQRNAHLQGEEGGARWQYSHTLILCPKARPLSTLPSQSLASCRVLPHCCQGVVHVRAMCRVLTGVCDWRPNCLESGVGQDGRSISKSFPQLCRLHWRFSAMTTCECRLFSMPQRQFLFHRVAAYVGFFFYSSRKMNVPQICHHVSRPHSS